MFAFLADEPPKKALSRLMLPFFFCGGFVATPPPLLLSFSLTGEGGGGISVGGSEYLADGDATVALLPPAGPAGCCGTPNASLAGGRPVLKLRLLVWGVSSCVCLC